MRLNRRGRTSVVSKKEKEKDRMFVRSFAAQSTSIRLPPDLRTYTSSLDVISLIDTNGIRYVAEGTQHDILKWK